MTSILATGLIAGCARHVAYTEHGGATWESLEAHGVNRAPWAYGFAAGCGLLALWVALRRT